jgi:hypothetical protein
MTWTRRDLLLGGLGVVAGGLAGCVGQRDTGSGGSPTDAGEEAGGGGDSGAGTGRTETARRTEFESPIPTAEGSLHLAYDMETLRKNVRAGGPPKDGIPSIDDPKFAGASGVDLDDGEPVFGLVRNGVVRAYQQRILAHHEIVNDVVGGEGVAITYCPLTGTAQGFERGDVEFGVSGRLLNSNLVMYDRHADSRWPQMLGTAISGPMTGATLREFRLVWMTWGRWKELHPDTEILTEDTGFARRYDNDPYGDYNPASGYYSNHNTLFPPLEPDNRAGTKTVVIGARDSEGALALDKNNLLLERVATTSIGDTGFVAVAEPTLQTGYVYENPGGLTVEADGDQYRVDGEQYGATDLPLDRLLAFDSMWFAWAGYYPETTYVE